jgi:hypothetical protein
MAGCKGTETNCGMCNPALVTKDNELIPDASIMKYRKRWQPCPFDMRAETASDGCFYSCFVFQKAEKAFNYRAKLKELIHTAEVRLSKGI